MMSNVDKLVEDCVRMPCTMQFVKAEDVEWGSKTQVSVVGTKESLAAVVAAGLLPPEVGNVVSVLVGRLTPTPLKCAAASHTFLVPCGGVEEVVVGVVSKEANRHASPHRADQVRNFVRKNVTLAATSALLLAAPSQDALYTYATSAPKGQSLCKLKGKNDGFDPGLPTMQTALWVSDRSDITVEQLQQAAIIAASVQLAARLVDLPTNYLHTESYSRIISGLAERFGFKSELHRGEKLEELGMNLLYTVGRAAEHPAVLAVLSHEPQKPQGEEVVCWAGKGIVYDTGGLQIKGKDGMKGMKKDMGGSAAVLSSFVAAVRLNVPVKLHALLALADNAVCDRSYRPDDVLRCLSGRTVEINNTDAEGRLVLSDAVAYAHKYLNPTTLVDMATLTGAQGIATGQHFAAICANTEEIETQALEAGKKSGDQCFPVLFAPEFLLQEFDSSVADHQNSVANRSNAQVSCAGLFIYKVSGLADGYQGHWLHVDMAFPVEAEEGKGTGWGVSFLLKLLPAVK